MTGEALYEALGEISGQYVLQAGQPGKKPGRRRRAAWAACLCAVVAGALLFFGRQGADFNSMVNRQAADAAAVMTRLPVAGRTAWYEQVRISGRSLERYRGELYQETGASAWYLPEDAGNLKYLIRREDDGSLTLWRFTSFAVGENGTYTYGDVLSLIYGVDSADEIVSITTSPLKANQTPEGKKIQQEVGTRTVTDREEIAAFYGIAEDVVCFGPDGENPADDGRFSYSFSTDASDKLTSGESTYGTRCLSLALADGTVLDSWKYSALSGSFFEYGGLFTEPLADDDVDTLNEIFRIQ